MWKRNPPVTDTGWWEAIQVRENYEIEKKADWVTGAKLQTDSGCRGGN